MIELTASERRLIRELQEGLAIVPEPFEEVGRRVGMSPAQVIGKINQWKERGLIRRFGAILRHIEAGMAANAMVVWAVPAERVPEVGEAMASAREVSHCYERPTFEGWPYNLYTMVHARTPEECEQVAKRIGRLTGVTDYQLLYTTKEYKKESPRYFS